MISLKRILIEITKEEEEEIQTLVDVISMCPKCPNYQKYKKILKDKYNVDYDKEYGDNDDSLIKNASLDDIKTKKDFLDFNHYIKYAKKIFDLRKLATTQPKLKTTKLIDIDTVRDIGNKFNFKVKHKEYSGIGNYAQVENSGDTMTVPLKIDGNLLIHELGHVYDYKIYKDGISRIITNASSPYMIDKADEVFAENFMHYFLAPSWLKKHLPHVYSDLNSRIKSNWKQEIYKLIK